MSVAVLGAVTYAEADPPPPGATFDEVWSQVASDPYPSLPHYEVSVSGFFSGWHNKLTSAAKRTLADQRDILPWFEKLVHPNGICLKGVWRITEDSPYSGYFAKGSEGLFIGRASTALTETRRGQYRAFGFAGKIFPTMDPAERVRTANFFTIEDLGGTLTAHYLDAANTNDIIHVTVRPSSVFLGPLAFVVANSFAEADQTLDVTQTLIRQLYPISSAGAADSDRIETPRWLMITGAAEVARVDEEDFRDELRIDNYPNGLAFEIWVASKGTRLGPKAWQRIGRIDIDDTALTDSCDHRLHFTHPPYR